MKDCIVHISNRQITNRKAIANFFNDLKDGKYLLSAKSIKRRSLSQNSYYWSCVVPMIAEGLRNEGWDDIKDDIDAHEFLKDRFLKRKIVNIQTGEVLEVPGSTAKLTTGEFNILIDEAIKLGAEFLNISIPYPNEPAIMFATYDQSTNSTIISNEM